MRNTTIALGIAEERPPIKLLGRRVLPAKGMEWSARDRRRLMMLLIDEMRYQIGGMLSRCWTKRSRERYAFLLQKLGALEALNIGTDDFVEINRRFIDAHLPEERPEFARYGRPPTHQQLST